MDTKWPLYYHDNLILGNQSSSVGVATLWTPKEQIAKKLDTQQFKVVGQLYSNDGINPLLRNVLANPTIRTIVLCGQDRIGSADALRYLIKNGINSKGEVIGKEEAKVEKEISAEAVERFRQNVSLVDLGGEMNGTKVQDAINSCTQNVEPWAEPETFPEPDLSADWYPSEGGSYTYRGKTVAEVWPKVLHDILRFGEAKMSHHTNAGQRELLNVSTVITDEDPGNIAWADYFDFTKDHFERYKPQVLTAEPLESLSYTYGMRLRDHNGVNQIDTIIQKIKDEPWSRRAVAVLWNVADDNDSTHPPCLDLVQCLVKYDKLYMTCMLRSNDMFQAWPENALAFRAMQAEIAAGVDRPMGALTIISGSAHIYDESIPKAKQVVETAYCDLPCEQDPRGNYVIKVVAGSHIEVIHMTPTGTKVGKYEGKTAMNIFNQIAGDQGVSVIIHALDLGAELQKAEIALKHGLEYTQDRPLPLKDKL